MRRLVACFILLLEKPQQLFFRNSAVLHGSQHYPLWQFFAGMDGDCRDPDLPPVKARKLRVRAFLPLDGYPEFRKKLNKLQRP